MVEEEFDPEARELCPEGSCTGLIGDDGKCKLCGAAGKAPVRGERAPSAVATAEESLDAADAPDFVADRGEHVFEDENRALCSDGACIGVLNSQGVCKVCGKTASS